MRHSTPSYGFCIATNWRCGGSEANKTSLQVCHSDGLRHTGKINRLESDESQ